MGSKVAFGDLPADVQEAIHSLVSYAWDSREIDDYKENYPASKGHHVFESAVTVQNWIDGTGISPEDVAGVECEEDD